MLKVIVIGLAWIITCTVYAGENAELYTETASTNNATDRGGAIPKPGPLKALSGNLVKPELREISAFVTKPASVTNAVTPYIAGGIPASRGEYPEYGSLWVDGLDGYIYFICGSTLISNNKVLTAAHCTINYPAYRLYVIPNFYSHDDPVSQNQVYQANNKYVHSKFNVSTFNDNDISILSLARSVNTARAKIYGGSNQFTNNT